MRKEMIKPFVWGIVVGAIVLLIVIFSTGWVMTSGSAKAKAEEAVVDRLAPICVAQFLKEPGKEERLKALKDLSRWKRGDYVKEGGWATMPGSESPNPEVVDECARRLMELEQ